MKRYTTASKTTAIGRSAAVAVIVLGFGASVASAASLSRTIEVKGTPAAVWSAIGAFCAIKDWLPPVGICIEDGKAPPTRTLVTKDGNAAFVERQTARNDKAHTYSYVFVASPLPVTNYSSTIEVTAKGEGISVVTWTGTYMPDAGKEKDANEALDGIYEAGLSTIKARFAK
jgi:hypothetical protein